MRLNNRLSIKRGQMLPTFDTTITVFNKLKATHSPTQRDIWYKTVIPLCAYSIVQISNANGATLNIAAQYVVRVPKDQRYIDYDQWVKDPSKGFSMSVGDIIVKGETKEIDITNASVILQKYQPNAFMVKTFSDNTGTVELAEHYCIRGG